MKYRKKPVIVDAITFDELLLIENKAKNALAAEDLLWSFEYAGHSIVRENDHYYLIPTLEGTMRFGREDMLITGLAGEIYPCKKDIFEKSYELIQSDINNKSLTVDRYVNQNKPIREPSEKRGINPYFQQDCFR